MAKVSSTGYVEEKWPGPSTHTSLSEGELKGCSPSITHTPGQGSEFSRSVWSIRPLWAQAAEKAGLPQPSQLREAPAPGSSLLLHLLLRLVGWLFLPTIQAELKLQKVVQTENLQKGNQR